MLRSEGNRLAHELRTAKLRVDENLQKVELNRQLPYLISSVVELLDLDPKENDAPEEQEDDGGALDLDQQSAANGRGVFRGGADFPCSFFGVFCPAQGAWRWWPRGKDAK